jgi:hypothetical protein
MAESPAVAATTWKKLPISRPATADSATLLPSETLRLMIYSTAGPGMTSKASDAMAKARIESMDGMPQR